MNLERLNNVTVVIENGKQTVYMCLGVVCVFGMINELGRVAIFPLVYRFLVL